MNRAVTNRVVMIAALGLLGLAATSCTMVEPTAPEAISPAKPAPQEQEQAPPVPAPAPRGPMPRRERLRTVGVDASVQSS